MKMLSKAPCGPYILVPVKENTGVFFIFILGGFAEN